MWARHCAAVAPPERSAWPCTARVPRRLPNKLSRISWVPETRLGLTNLRSDTPSQGIGVWLVQPPTPISREIQRIQASAIYRLLVVRGDPRRDATTPQEVLRLLLQPADRVHHRLLPLHPPLRHEHRRQLLRPPTQPGPSPLLLPGATALLQPPCHPPCHC